MTKTNNEKKAFLDEMLDQYFSNESLTYTTVGDTPIVHQCEIFTDRQLAEAISEMGKQYGFKYGRMRVLKYRKAHKIDCYDERVQRALFAVFNREEIPLSDTEIAFNLGIAQSTVFQYRTKNKILTCNERMEIKLMDTLDKLEMAEKLSYTIHEAHCKTVHGLVDKHARESADLRGENFKLYFENKDLKTRLVFLRTSNIVLWTIYIICAIILVLF